MPRIRSRIPQERPHPRPSLKQVTSHHSMRKDIGRTQAEMQPTRPSIRERSHIMLREAVDHMAGYCGRKRAVRRIAAAAGMPETTVITYLVHGVPDGEGHVLYDGVHHAHWRMMCELCGVPSRWRGRVVKILRRGFDWSRADLARELNVETWLVRDVEEGRRMFRRFTQKRLDWLWISQALDTGERTCLSAHA